MPVMFINMYFWVPLGNSSSTGIHNVNNNQQEELGIIDLNPVSIFMVTREIFSHPQNIDKGLTQWGLVPLGPTLINTTKDMNYFL